MKSLKKDTNNEQKKLGTKDIAIVVLSAIMLILLVVIVFLSRRRDQMITESLEQNSEISTDDAIASVNSSTMDYLEITEISGDKWFELHNKGTEAIDISGLQVKISDKLDTTVEDGTSIKKDEYLTIELKSNPGKEDSNIMSICDADGVTIKSALVPKLDEDMSFGIADSAENIWGYMFPTKGKENSTKDIQYLQMEGIFYSAPGGFYNSSFKLEFKCAEGEKLYYTTDGSVPTDESELYVEPITISNKSGSNYVYAKEALIDRFSSNYMPGSVDSGMIVRALRVDASGNTIGEFSQAYYIGLTKDSDYLNLPVISITTDPENLFDYEHGIYIAGKQREDAIIQGFKPEFFANFYNAWQKESKIEYYEPTKDKTFEMQAMLSINTDQNIAGRQKGLILSIADKSYSDFAGSSLTDYISSAGNIRLTSSFQDDELKIRNMLANSLVEGTDIAGNGCQLCVVFIDGEYWGLYTFRPYQDEKFVQQRYDLEGKKIIIHDANIYNDLYQEFYNYVTQNNLAIQQNYEQVETMLDIDNYIDYVCFNIYLGNAPFYPQNGTAWRTEEADGQGMADGRWRFISGDFANTAYISSMQTSTIDSYLQTGIQGDLILQSLLMNDEFCKKFDDRMKKMATEVFEEEKVDESLDAIVSLTKKPVIKSYQRFHGELSEYGYSARLDNIKAFFEERAEYIIPYTEEFTKKGGDLEKAREIIKKAQEQEREDSAEEDVSEDEESTEEDDSENQEGMENSEETNNG